MSDAEKWWATLHHTARADSTGTSSPDHVLGEMQQLSDLGYRSIYLTDDHFLLKRERIKAICQGMIDQKLQFKWGLRGPRGLGRRGSTPDYVQLGDVPLAVTHVVNGFSPGRG